MRLDEAIQIIENHNHDSSLAESTPARITTHDLAMLLKDAGNKVTMEPWKDGTVGISIRHGQRKFLQGVKAIKDLKNNITGFTNKRAKGSFSYKGNEYLFQPYKGYIFIMPLTERKY